MSATKIDIGPVGERVARNIAAIRKGRRLQYAELSKLMTEAGRYMPPLSLRRIETFERRVDAQDLVTLAEILGVSVEGLLLSDIEVHTEFRIMASQ